MADIHPADDFDPRQYLLSMGLADGFDAEKLEHFKDCASVFLQWLAQEDESTPYADDILEVEQATTADQVIAVLRRHDTDGLFLAFVKEYC